MGVREKECVCVCVRESACVLVCVYFCEGERVENYKSVREF